MTPPQRQIIEQSAMAVLRLAAILDVMGIAIQEVGLRETITRALGGGADLARQIAAGLDTVAAGEMAASRSASRSS